MNISFNDKKFERQCNEHRQLVKKHGALRAKKIAQRLGLLQAAHNLADIEPFGPFGRCHELKGDRAGQLALDSLTLTTPTGLSLSPTIPRRRAKRTAG